MTRPSFMHWLVVFSMGVAVDAAADPAADAKPHVDAGVKAYTAGDYEAAIAAFETAHGIHQDPVTLYAWAQAQRLGKHCDKAIPLYRRYLETKPTDDQIAAANHGITLCEEELASRPPPKETRPGETHGSPWYKDTLGGALAIGGVAGLAVGGTFMILSSRSSDAADKAKTRDEFVGHVDDANFRRKVGFVGLGVGAALVIGSVVRYATRPRRDVATVTVSVDASGSLIVFGRF